MMNNHTELALATAMNIVLSTVIAIKTCVEVL